MIWQERRSGDLRSESRIYDRHRLWIPPQLSIRPGCPLLVARVWPWVTALGDEAPWVCWVWLGCRNQHLGQRGLLPQCLWPPTSAAASPSAIPANSSGTCSQLTGVFMNHPGWIAAKTSGQRAGT